MVIKRTTDEKIIAALISCPTNKAAAEALGIGLTTLYKRFKDPEFQETYRETCKELLKDHTAALQARMGRAIEVMAEIMDDPKATAQTRLNAADTVLRHGTRLTEQVSILNRLDELEGED